MTPQFDSLRDALSDRYELQAELGRGGMALVYAARDLKHERRVAVKVLRPELAAAIGAERFLAEIQTTANLQHPHIVPLFDSGEAEGHVFYVMPLLEGESLRDLLDRRTTLGPAEATRIAAAVARGLDHAHRKGILHRDVKPENILLQDGEPVIADFGIALALGTLGDERLTETGISPGTPRYMSPEQLAGQAEIAGSTDVYSLACVLYEMLTGAPPHADGSPRVMLSTRLTASPADLPGFGGSIPKAIAPVLLKALEPEPSDRFHSAAAFGEALEAAMISPVARRRPAALAAAGAVLVAAGGAVFWGMRPAPQVTAEDLAQLDSLHNSMDFSGTFDRVERLLSRTPGDPILEERRLAVSFETELTSDPSGATVRWRPYRDSVWRSAGTTPLSVWLPLGMSVLEYTLDGYRPALAAAGEGFGTSAPEPVRLLPADATPEDATWIPGFSTEDGVELGPYLLDTYEVTNREYKEFVDAGGYANPEFWPDSLEIDGRRLSWEQARGFLVDRTGRPGPATWTVSGYEAGMDDYPVGGVSWYEAAAYAAFRGRDLPTLHHWRNAAPRTYDPWIGPASNLSADELLPVGVPRGIARYGNSDMAGNVREWTYNSGPEGRHVPGGAWDDEPFRFSMPMMLPAWDRHASNGFRLATYLDSTNVDRAREPVVPFLRTYDDAEPVSDDVFAGYARMYQYDAVALDASAVTADTTDHWVRERVSFTAGYDPGNERVVAYIYRPLGAVGPLQPIIFYPGGSAFGPGRTIDDYVRVSPGCTSGMCRLIQLMLRGRRAFVFPVYSGLFERSFAEDPRSGTGPDRLLTIAYRDFIIRTMKDVRRTVDYLETRADLDHGRVAYLGMSMGGWLSSLALATEPRLKAGVSVIGGLAAVPVHPEMDPINFVPRVTQPVLMLNARHDPEFPLEGTARPMYERLPGEPGVYKKLVDAEGGHFLPNLFVAEHTLAWLDQHLGPASATAVDPAPASGSSR